MKDDVHIRAQRVLQLIYAEGLNWRHIENTRAEPDLNNLRSVKIIGLGKRSLWTGQAIATLTATFERRGLSVGGGSIIEPHKYAEDCIAAWTLERVRGKLTVVPIVQAPLQTLTDDEIVKRILNSAASYFDVKANRRSFR